MHTQPPKGTVINATCLTVDSYLNRTSLNSIMSTVVEVRTLISNLPNPIQFFSKWFTQYVSNILYIGDIFIQFQISEKDEDVSGTIEAACFEEFVFSTVFEINKMYCNKIYIILWNYHGDFLYIYSYSLYSTKLRTKHLNWIKGGTNHPFVKEIPFMFKWSDTCFSQRENNTFIVNMCWLLKNHQSYQCIIS